LLIGWMTVVGTFLSDLLLVWADPRVKFEGR
jgi:ABC-type dipeptide/oligopeptide/nickel transport system permease component